MCGRVQLAAALAHNRTLQSIDLTGNNIGLAGAEVSTVLCWNAVEWKDSGLGHLPQWSGANVLVTAFRHPASHSAAANVPSVSFQTPNGSGSNFQQRGEQ